MTMLREVVACAWFLAVGAAFWGAYAGLPVAAALTPVYGLLLVAAVVTLALRLLSSARPDVRADSGAGADDAAVIRSGPSPGKTKR